MKENLDAAKSVIDSISENVWSIFFSVLALYVCWLTAVYLIAPDFYKHAPLMIYLVVCLAITIQDYLTNFLLVFLAAVSTTERNPSKRPDRRVVDILIAGISLITFGGALLVWYITGWRFRYLVVVPTIIKYIPIFILLKQRIKANSDID